MSSTSITTTIELVEAPIRRPDGPSPITAKTSGQEALPSFSSPARTLGKPGTPSDSHESSRGNDVQDVISALPAPTTVSQPLERWNHPRGNPPRVFAAFWSLMVMGMNDAAYGAIIPYMGPYYNLSYTLVSLIFLSPFVGYTLSALLNNWIHTRFGQRGIALLCGGCHLAAYVIACLHPPYPALVVVYSLAGFGNGIGDAAWNAWMGAMANANEVLGVMHAFYGLGGVLAPLVATAMITRLGAGWYEFYYVMIAAAAVELVALGVTFWPRTGRVFREAHPKSPESGDRSRMHEALLRMPAARVSWLCAMFLLCYVGVEVALGGWIVTFMIDVRHGAAFASGMTATGFWLGLTFGRVILGFVTPRLGERLAIMVRICESSRPVVDRHAPFPKLILATYPDLSAPRNGSRTSLLAGPTVYRLCRCRGPSRILLGAAVSSCGCGRHQVPPQASPCQYHRIRCCLWWWWCRSPAVRGRCHCTVQGRQCVAAHYPYAVGCSLRVVAGTAKLQQETRIDAV